MYSFADVQREIGAKIQHLMQTNGPVLHPDWMLHSLLADHPDVDGKDADFYKCCTKTTVLNEIRQQINRRKVNGDNSEESAQLVMPGFEFLQKHYVVHRDKEQCIVRIDLLTDEEIESKAQEREAMGRACFAHADELRRYRDLRKAAA